jgi:4'-phosphopantetheinyl transferase
MRDPREHGADWRTPPADVALGAGEVHVWRVSLVQPPEAIAALADTLSPDERERAARFHFERDRAAFTVARGALRALLGRYLARLPGDLGFGYHARGKPYLAAPAGDRLRFNLSHSGGLALIALTQGREVGVDIEHKRALQDLTSLARISFAPGEYATLCGLAPRDQPDAFFACWSRKEAFIKATGEGVSQLADFDVTLRPGEPARLLRIDGAFARRRWSLHELPVSPGYAAALVVEGIESEGVENDGIESLEGGRVERDGDGSLAIRCWDWHPIEPLVPSGPAS